MNTSKHYGNKHAANTLKTLGYGKNKEEAPTETNPFSYRNDKRIGHIRKTKKEDATVKKEKATATNKPSQNIQITFSHDKSTKTLLDELVWLKQYVIDMEDISQGDIIRQGLELLATQIEHKKLSKKHADKLENYKPKWAENVNNIFNTGNIYNINTQYGKFILYLRFIISL